MPAGGASVSGENQRAYYPAETAAELRRLADWYEEYCDEAAPNPDFLRTAAQQIEYLRGRSGPLLEHGVCRSCGCTDENACPGGCSWLDEEHTLCSACVVERQELQRLEGLLEDLVVAQEEAAVAPLYGAWRVICGSFMTPAELIHKAEADYGAIRAGRREESERAEQIRELAHRSPPLSASLTTGPWVRQLEVAVVALEGERLRLEAKLAELLKRGQA